MASFNGIRRSSPVLSGSVRDVSAEGLRAAVVGGTGGLGRAIARFLVARGGRVTVIGRTERDPDVERLEFVEADLSSIAEMHRVGSVLPAEDLDLLVLTTGIMTAPQREVTPDGVERDLAVSYLSRFVLIHALAERLGARRPARPRVFVAGFPGTGEAGNPDDLNAEVSYRPMAQHLNTVAANEALVLDAARRYPRLAVFGLNPGLVSTGIRANFLGGAGSLRFRVVEALIGLLTPSPDAYARRVVTAMLAPELETESGFHLDKKGRPIEPSAVMTPERVAAFVAATHALLDRAKGAAA